jgi:hypothetical protein
MRRNGAKDLKDGLKAEPTPYRRPVLRIVSLTQDNGFAGNTLAKVIASPDGGASVDAIDRMDAVDSLADVLSDYDRKRLAIFLRGGISLPADVAKRVRERVGLPRMCHLFGMAEPAMGQSFA